ncbi:MAG: class I tRNA ligase family protein, partial [Pirellulaceae bacterium]
QEENKTRHDLGREKLVELIWKWKNQYEDRIISQLKQMGCSCDWDRKRFTLDEMCARAVRFTFFDLFREDKIYRGKRLVNWDTFLQTAVSDDEVFNETVRGNFWHFKYPVIDPQPGEPEFVAIATTRPETMLADTAVAVHPDPAAALDKVEAELRHKLADAREADRKAIDTQIEALDQRRSEFLPRLQQLAEMAAAGRRLRLPLMDREIPLITDHWAKPELGSGCVKITPAHDPNDYEVGQRADLPMINVLNPDGTLNAEAGKYEGLAIKQARKQVVADLEALELVEEIEQRDIELPFSDRSKTPIEPLLADQWFVRMGELSQSAMDAVTSGQITIHPHRYTKGYLDWLSEKRDWPVSRQLWWGHQIPVWSKAVENESEIEEIKRELVEGLNINGTTAAVQIEPCAETDDAKRRRLNLPLATIHVGIQKENDPLEKLVEDLGFVREEDVLDTWFSSALWPHSTLGWPEQTEDLQYFYPTSVLITSRDIITLWVARMVLMGLHNVGEIPFRHVYIHPKILDGEGETMSKTKGNGIDPLDVIEKFGADALRFGMTHLTTETQDVRIPVQFECPNCATSIDQTRKNRQLPRIECPGCKKSFGTQWSESDEDQALPRGPVLSERFEVARNFGNKLWNASRFAMMHLDDYSVGPLDPAEFTIEDRWILSRLTTVISQVTNSLEHYHYSEAARDLYAFAWEDFCSSYLEILKERFADPQQRVQAQRMLAHTLDHLLRLLHPIMPFITEEIWQKLADYAPSRGCPIPHAASPCLIVEEWPLARKDDQDQAIEKQFALFQAALAAVRKIRSDQNLPPKKEIRFAIRTNDEVASALQPLLRYFPSMAKAECTGMSADVESPSMNATVTLESMEVVVDLEGLIDKDAECKRLEREREKLVKSIAGKNNKLANEKFVTNAPPDIVQRERDSLQKMTDQLHGVEDSMSALGCG